MAQPKKESVIQRFSTGTKPKVEKGDTFRIWRKTGECLSGIYLFVISCHLNLLFFRQVPEALQDEGQYIVEETKTESKLETLRRTIGEGFDNAMDSIPKLIPKVKEAFVTMETQMSDPDTIDRLANDAAQQVIRPSLRPRVPFHGAYAHQQNDRFDDIIFYWSAGECTRGCSLLLGKCEIH